MLEATSQRFIEKEYKIEEEALNAALFTTGNGYMGVRGSFEEYGSIRIQGAYIRGVIDEIIEVMEPFADNEYMKKYYIDEDKLKDFEYQDSVVNNADFLLLRVSVDGETFYPWEGKILSWERYIDMTTACLVRSVRWENSKGDITDFRFERFASFADDHIYCIKLEVTPINHSKKISIMSGTDTRVKTGGQKITSILDQSAWDNKTFLRMSMGKKYGFETAVTTTTSIQPQKSEWIAKNQDGLLFSHTEFESKKGCTYQIEKNVYLISSREGSCEKPTELQESYSKYYQEHIREYTNYFGKIDMKITGDEKADGGVRFSNYHSAISIARNDDIHSLAAKGLTGERYNNFVWWDCEVYQMPVFLYTNPESAKNVLMYRCNRLEQSMKNAKEAGFSGAKYAFCSSVNGDERVWEYARHPFMQVHINADIAWGVIHYYTVTGDRDFLKQHGMKLLIALCEYWKSRVNYEDGKYVINQVTGTDEHHPYVNNDAYTNYLVHYVLKKTTEYCKMLGMEHDYSEIAEKLYLPMNECGMIPQFDGYFDLSRTLEEAGGSDATKFQMKSSGLYHKSQVIKQPDVMLLYSYLNLAPETSDYAANWDYYEKMCESSSSLSFAPHSICAADNGRILSAYNYLIETGYVDVYDLHHCGWQGVHSGCAAGAWVAMFRGFGGIVCEENCIRICPHMVPWWDSVEFGFTYHGISLHVTMTKEKYVLTSDSDTPISVLFMGMEYQVTKTQKMECAMNTKTEHRNPCYTERE